MIATRCSAAAFLLLLSSPTGFSQDLRRALPVEVARAPVSLNEEARFLAGYPLPPDSPLGRIQSSSAGKVHAAAFERLWARYNEHRFIPMRAWSAAELSPRILPTAPVLYFFSGPDAISALALYPFAPDYLLGGLEPVGALPAPESLPRDRLNLALDNLRGSTDVILSYGHFITKEMKDDLEATEFRGVLPVVLAFIAMTGGEVLEYCYFRIDQEGYAQDTGRSNSDGKASGVRITFRKDAASPPQRIHYVQADVANDSPKSRDSFLRWVERFGNGNVYLKAASYLMHESSFSGIRDFLLRQAASILQDDSGIPFSFFQNGDWRCYFFGAYTGTLDIFKKYHQADLDRAFQAAGVALAFGTGYKWKEGESNLLLAIRQAPPRAEPIAEPLAPVEPAVITRPVY